MAGFLAENFGNEWVSLNEQQVPPNCFSAPLGLLSDIWRGLLNRPEIMQQLFETTGERRELLVVVLVGRLRQRREQLRR